MDKFWKIPKQWVSDFGLSWNEAGLLADMVEWDCPMQEHATRCRLTERTLSNALDSIAEKAEKFSELRAKIFRKIFRKIFHSPHTPLY